MLKNRATATATHTEPKMATKLAADIGCLLQTVYTSVRLRKP